MILDEKLISEGITPDLLYKLILKHNSSLERYEKLRR